MSTLTEAVTARDPAPVTAPSVAKLTHWLLGGRHHLRADRNLGKQVLRAAPWFEDAVKINALHAHQTVAMLRASGIRQFVDLGSGLPTSNPRFPHTALSAGPDTTVIHVDCDPAVIEHGPQLLNSRRPTNHRFMHADLRNMLYILREMPLHGLDPSRPTGFLCHDVLPWIPDDADARASMKAILDWAPPGSALSLTHSTADLCHDGTAAAAAHCFTAAGLPVQLRTAEEIRDLTQATARPWHIRSPGIVPVSTYHPARYRMPVPDHHSGGYAAILIHPEHAHH
ncbi:SAM-dependent methyltransferase [Streptomyces sp. NPDC001933]|uniref:SAM-dependent methyltransferase n=1 Tax=Streptomyces sp. NPDC001933 TaxID=3364626 RepID=UPI0036CC64AF